MHARRLALSLTLATTLVASSVPAAFASPVRLRNAAATSVSVTPAVADGSEATTDVADNRVLVRVKGSVTADKLGRIYRSADTSAGAVRVVRGDTLSWRPPAGTTSAEFAEKLADTDQVEFA